MRWLAMALFAASAAVAAGCRSSCDRVESELRAREEDVRFLKEEVGRLGCTTQLLERELAATRGLPGPDGVLRPPSEPWPVRSLVIGRGTGAAEGCEGLVVIVEPRDCEDHAIKAPGALTLELIERPQQGERRLIRRWEVPPDDLRGKWQSGLFSSGYKLLLELDARPSTERLRVVVRLRLIDGRVFEADRDLEVRLPVRPRAPASVPPPAPQKAPPPEPEPPAQSLPPPHEETPPPDKKPKQTAPDAGPILTRLRGDRPTAELGPPVPTVDEEEE